MLEVPYNRLVYHLYKVKPARKYTRFVVPKKSGGQREIIAPVSAIKLIQKKLNNVLNSVYQPKASSHGFVIKKSIVTNAWVHKGKRFVLNVDLKDFFPSVNFGRVRGMFLNVPYELNSAVATVLAQTCCYKDDTTDQLPQGAPTSPIITNMLCAKMDSQLRRLAERNQCDYTRYADDLTFSTSCRQFPIELARVAVKKDSEMSVKLGSSLVQIIRDNGFEINAKKIRLQTREFRQEVTGLTVNNFPNVSRKFVRQIRAMIHAWEKYGLADAEKEFLAKYYHQHRNPGKNSPLFAKVLRGRIEFLGMVRGKSDVIYLKCLNKYNSLAGLPELPIPTLENELGLLKSSVKQIEAEVEVATVPHDFSFIPEAHSEIVSVLQTDSKNMYRSKKKDNFIEFCRFAFLQLESGIKRATKTHYNELYATASNHSYLKNKIKPRNLLQTNMVHLIQLCTEYWKTELVAGGWLRGEENYWYHDFENPYANPYCVLHYVREIRNLAFHREGSGSANIFQRLTERVEEMTGELDKVDIAIETSKERRAALSYQIQTLEQAKRACDARNYDAVENALYGFLAVILAK
ncbi:MAG: reverse transcriptase domain-containing protein [Bacteroidota bacterium]